MLNVVILIGRLVADPEMSSTSSGVMKARFRLAVNRKYKNQQGEIETDFINVTAWRKLAELCGQYIKKGRLVAVNGRLQVRSYQTPEGENRRYYEVVAEEVRFLDRGDRSEGPSDSGPGVSGDFPDDMPEDSSVPF